MTFTLEFETADDTVYALAADGKDCCFAACSAGLFRSSDAGASWQRLSPSSEIVTTAVALSPAFANDRSLFAAVKGGILRSSDAGDTWHTAAFPAPPPLFSCLALSPDFERDGVLLAGTLEDGIFSSADRGLRWQPWNFGLFDLSVLCLALSPHWPGDETVFAGTETGLYRSGNGGRAWRFTGFPTEFAPVLSLALAVDQASGETLLFAGGEAHGLQVSCDQGESWQGLALDSALNQLQVQCAGDGPFVLYALVDNGVARSEDGGKSWACVQRTEAVPTAMLLLDDALLLGLHGRGIMRLPLA